MLTRLGVAGFLSMCVMICSIFLFGREIYEGEAVGGLSTQFAVIVRYLSLLLATPVLFLLGWPILRNAMSQWQSRVISTDSLIVLGVAAAFVYSYCSTIFESGTTYFETACMILLLVTLGRWFEAVGKLRATEQVRSLEALIPPDVVVMRAGVESSIRIDDVRVGDRLVVRAGQRIGVDARIETGTANIDEQIVTGESRPTVREAGDTVRAGTLNLDGHLILQATHVGGETTLGRLIAFLEAARQAKGRYERIADRVASSFLPVTLLIAMVGAILGYRRGGADEAIMSAMSVLLIACPCALGIATPMAVWVSLGRAASRGILIRTGEALEALERVRTIFFDKTGTLTTGVARVTEYALDERACDESEVLALVKAISARSDHVISQGLVSWPKVRSARPETIQSVRTIAGRGLVAGTDRGEVFLGSPALMDDSRLSRSPQIDARIQAWSSEGRSVVCIGWDGSVRAVFSLDESIRAEAADAIRSIEAAGFRPAVLTGDHPGRGAFISKILGISTHAGLMPEHKVTHIRSSQDGRSLVAMVGDGLNDAPAMAAADVGIAMGCGADVTRDNASVCLIGNDLRQLSWLLNHARRTVRAIRVNLFWAYFYNAIGLALAVTGRLSPVFAAVAMVVSSLFVIGNSLRLNRDGGAHSATVESSPSGTPEVAL